MTFVIIIILAIFVATLAMCVVLGEIAHRLERIADLLQQKETK